MRIGLALLIIFFVSSRLSAAEIQLQIGNEQFKFSEYDPNDVLLVREQGSMPFILSSLDYRWSQIKISSSYFHVAGLVDYIGQTQSGQAHVTQTAETIQDLGVAFHWLFGSPWQADASSVFIELGGQQWIRDIKTRNNVLGLYETYRWAYVAIGFDGQWLRFNRWEGRAKLQMLRTYGATMEIDFKGRYENSKLELGSHYGGKLSIPLYYRLNKSWHLIVEPYYRFWALGQSPHSPLTSIEGTVLGGLHEPRGSGQGYGASIGLSWRLFE